MRPACLLLVRIAWRPRACWAQKRWLSQSKPQSKPQSDPLHILFCGSDHFSGKSLEALHREHRANPGLIASIYVVTRRSKPTGRGMKTSTETPIKTLANVLGLPVEEIDTFTGWNLPGYPKSPINIIIAVSFGLFVPPRLLGATKYEGLNVHPSLLPDFRGGAPIQHALLAKRSHTGVSVQTLHPARFDEGTVVAQTPLPGVLIHAGTTYAGLRDQLAGAGASLLLYGLRTGAHVPPVTSAGWEPTPAERAGLLPAPLFRPADYQMRWDAAAAGEATAADVARRQAVLGRCWTALESPARRGGGLRTTALLDLAAAPRAPPALEEAILALMWEKHFPDHHQYHQPQQPQQQQQQQPPSRRDRGHRHRGVTFVQQPRADQAAENRRFGVPFVTDDYGGVTIPLRVPYRVSPAGSGAPWIRLGSPDDGDQESAPSYLRIGRATVEGQATKLARHVFESFACSLDDPADAADDAASAAAAAVQNRTDCCSTFVLLPPPTTPAD